MAPLTPSLPGNSRCAAGSYGCGEGEAAAGGGGEGVGVIKGRGLSPCLRFPLSPTPLPSRRPWGYAGLSGAPGSARPLRSGFLEL